MNLLQRKNLGVFCLLGMVLTLSAQAQRYSEGDPIGWPRITSPATRFGNDLPAGATITLQCWSTYDFDWDNCTGSSVYDGATITWTARDSYNHNVGTFIDNQGTTAVWIAPTAVGAVRICATADDDPDYLADDWPEMHFVDFDIVKRAYVKYNAPGARTGGNWYDAFTDLQDALELAGPGWEIWVAQGTYYPGTSQSATFTIPAGAAVYGGFCGNEVLLGEHQPLTYVTILSGDIDFDGLRDADNCYRVVSMSSGTLDGFTIEQGYGSSGSTGAGMYVSGSATIHECVIRNNQTNGALGHGGGLYLAASSAAISNCHFDDNQAGNNSDSELLDIDGGAVYINGGSPTFQTCYFDGNRSRDDGGAVKCNNASPTMTDCHFTGNSTFGSEGMGGAIEKQGGGLTLISCEIRGNNALRHGGGLRVTGGTFTMTGGTVADNVATRHDGGGLELQDCTADVNSVTVANNQALCTNPNGDGGGICVERSTVTVWYCTVQGNSCFDDGGGMRAKGDQSAGSVLRWLNRGNTVTGNSPDQVSIDGSSREE